MDGQLKRIVAQLFSVSRKRRRSDLIERLLWEFDLNEAEAEVLMVELIIDGQIGVFTADAFSAKSGRVEADLWIEPGPKFCSLDATKS